MVKIEIVFTFTFTFNTLLAELGLCLWNIPRGTRRVCLTTWEVVFSISDQRGSNFQVPDFQRNTTVWIPWVIVIKSSAPLQCKKLKNQSPIDKQQLQNYLASTY